MANTLILPPTQTITALDSYTLWQHIETLSQGTDITDTTAINAIKPFFGDVTAPQYRTAVYAGHTYTISNSSGIPLAWRLKDSSAAAVEYGFLDSGASLSSTFWGQGSLDLTPYFSFTCRLA